MLLQFSTGKSPLHHISNWVFGCPAFVLKKNLADNNGIPKWKVHAYQGIYLRHSEQHSSSVTLIWNPVTKLASTQYHVLFNEGFKTVTYLGNKFDANKWQLAFHNQLQSTDGCILTNILKPQRKWHSIITLMGTGTLPLVSTTQKSYLGWLPQSQQQTRIILHCLNLMKKVNPWFLIPKELQPCLKSSRIQHSCPSSLSILPQACQTYDETPISFVNLVLSLSQTTNNNESTMQNNPLPTTTQFLTPT